MDSNFKVRISADLTELEASLKNVQSLMGKVGNNAQASGKVIKESTEKATVAVSALNKTFQETNDKSGRARLAAFAFGQVIRDAGFFSQSFGLGLLAISNNIPVLIDQLVLLTGVSAGVGTALSLVGSLLTAGLTVWAYSSNAVDKNKQSIDEWRSSLEDTTEAQLKGKQAAMDEVVGLDVLYRATTNLSNSYQTRLAAAKQLQEQYPTAFANLSTEAIMVGKASSAYNELRDSIISAAMAEAAKDKIVENASRVLDNNIKVSKAALAQQKKKLELLAEEARYNKEFEAAQKAMASAPGKEGVDPFAAANRSLARQAELKKEIAGFQKIINDATTDTKILNERNAALTGEIGKNVDGYVSRMSDGKAQSGLTGIASILDKLKSTLTALNLDPTLSDIDRVKGKIDAYQSALKSLIDEGYKPNSDAVKNIVAELQKLNTTYDSLISKQEDLKKQTQFLNEIDKVAKSLESKRIDIYSGVDLSKSKQIKQEIEATADALSKFQALAKENPVLAQFAGLNTIIPLLTANLNDLGDKFENAVDTETAAKQIEDFNKKLVDILEGGAISAISSTMQGIGEAIATGGNVATAAGAALLGTLGSILTQLGELAIATGIAISGIKKALQSLNPVVAIAAGVALLALAGFVKGKAKSLAGGGGGGGGEQAPSGDFGSVRPFAKGGIISGPTNALMGEYPGARSNPEVVAPLDKLQNILGNSTGGGSQQVGSLETRISGNDLVILMERANKNRKNYF